MAGTPHRHPGGADDHRRQPDQGLRRGAADPDGQLHRLRQRRHLGQPDHPAHADARRPPPAAMSRAAPTPSPPAARSTPTTRISYVAGTLTVTPAALTITADNQTKVYGAALPTLTASYSGFVNGDTSASLTTQPTLTHDGHRQQPCRRQPLHHHRQRRGRQRLHDQLRRRHPDRHPGGADDHRRQPDQGLRRGAADADGQLLRLRQRRHLGQPDHPADADHDGHRQQPCRRQSLRHHRQRRGRHRLRISYVAGTLTVTAGGADDHGRQPDQGLRRGAADADAPATPASSTATPRPA